MGGAFDPVHFGHLTAAETARDKYNLDIVLFVPSGHPPHKNHENMTDPKHRFNMTRLAIKGNNFFKVSGIETNKSGISYSIDTIKKIKSYMGNNGRLFFIIGEDTAALVRTWKEYEQITAITEFIILTRPGSHETGDMPEGAEILTMPLLEISATDIREKIKNGRSARYLLPDTVEEYIRRNGLYAAYNCSIPDMLKYAEKTLTKKRYLHTTGVYEEALKLSRVYGADEEKAAAAAILHDIAKETTDLEKIRACEKYRIKCANFDIMHAPLAAAIAADKFGIRDTEILNAIKYHPTGRKNMSLIEKIIYLADAIEPHRGDDERLAAMRDMAYTDINKALILGLTSKISYVKAKNAPVHPLSAAALKFLTQNEL
jgi:nicotinate-nucleotide adenylyltransferase